MTTPNKAHYMGHRARLRARFHSAGGKGMHDYEVLELLLTFSIPRKDVKPLAKSLMERHGGLAGVMDAAFNTALNRLETGPLTTTLLRLVKVTGELYLWEKMKGKDVLSSPKPLVHFSIVKLAGLPHEAFMVVYLNTHNEIIHEEIINQGTVDQVAVYPRRIIEMALARQASGLILCHNHPSGYTAPSKEDKALTLAIKQAGRLFDIRLVDHLIVGKGGYFSFKEGGLL